MADSERRRHQIVTEEFQRNERLANVIFLLPEYIRAGVPKEFLQPLATELKKEVRAARQRSDFVTARRAERVIGEVDEVIENWDESINGSLARIRQNDPSFFPTDSDEYVRAAVHAATSETMEYFARKYAEAKEKVQSMASVDNLIELRPAFSYQDRVRIYTGA